MALWGRWWRVPRKYIADVPARDAMAKVADVVEVPEPFLQGYMVVGVLLDGTVAVAHNACCAQHFIEQTLRQLDGVEHTAAKVCERAGKDAK